MTDGKEINLKIRAEFSGKRDIDSVTQSIKELQDAVAKQGEAAKRGVGSTEDLKAAMLALKVVQDELKAQSDKVGLFKRLPEDIAKSEKSVEKAASALDEYQKKLAGLEAVSRKQQEQEQKYRERLEATRATVAKRQAQFAELSKSLQSLGVDTNRLAETEAKLKTNTEAVSLLFGQGQAAIRDYAANLETARNSAAALAKQQALLARLQDGNETDAMVGRLQKQAAATDLLAKRQAEQVRQQALLARLQEGNQTDARQAGVQRLASDQGLKRIADEATAAAKGYSTLAKASNDLRPRVVSLREAVDAINDPAKAARKSLAGVEEQIASVARNVGAAKGPIKDAAEQLKLLREAQRALSEQGGQVDAYARQVASLRAQRTELVAARQQVQQYVAAVRQGGAAGEAFTKPLAEAQSRLKAASTAMREQIESARALRQGLRDAGISTSNLADSQRRLTDAARAGVQASRSLAAGIEQQAGAAAKGGKAFRLFGDEGRTTLSLLQRIRGEVLALAAAYVGLFGVINLAKGALDASKEDTRLRSSIAFAQGLQPTDPAVGQEIEYIRAQADRLGFSLQAAGKSYGFFAAAAMKSGANLKETRFIFESMAEASTVLGLSADQLNGIFLAVGQSFSKGKIQAEELRGQIGERLPGAFAFAQEALKDVFPDLNKALEQGLVGAEYLVVIAESVRRAAQQQLPAAIKTLTTEQERFNNSVLLFKKEIADAGFADAYIGLLRQITTFLKGDEGKKFAQNLSDAFTKVIRVASFLLENLNSVQTVLIGIGAYLGVSLLLSFFAKLKIALVVLGPALASVATGFLAINSATAFTAAAFTVMQKALLGAVGAFLAFKAGFSIGTLLYESSESVRVFAAEIVTSLAKAWAYIKAGAETMWASLPGLAEKSLNALINLINNVFVRPFLVAMRGIASAFQIESLVQGIDKVTRDLSAKISFGVQDRTQQIANGLKRDLATIEDIRKDMIADAKRARAEKPAKASNAITPATTDFPGVRKGKPKDDDDKKAVAKRASDIEALESALDALDNRIDRKNKDVLRDQLAVVDREFADLAKRIAQLGGKEAIAFARRLSKSDLALRQQTEDTFNKRRLDAFEALLSQVEDAEVASGRKRKTELDAQLQAIETAYLDKYRKIEAERSIIQDNGGDTGAIDALTTRLRLAEDDAKALARKDALTRQLAEREQQINNIVETRASKVKSIEDKVAAGILTRSEGDQAQLDAIAKIQPQLEGMVLSGQAFANAMQGSLDPVKLQEFIDKLLLVQGSASRMNAELDRTGTIINDGIGKGVDATLSTTYDSLVKVAQGSASWGDAFQAAGVSILQTLAQILKEIAATIIKEQILIQIQMIRKSLSAGSGNLTESATGAAVFHAGGVVGQSATRKRSVPSDWFAGAPRYHSGGVPGLSADEYTAILKKNEEVLTTTDPRNVLNGGMQGGNAAQPQAQRFVLVDDRARMAEAMAGAEGEEVTMIHLRKNIPTLRQMIKGA